MNLPKDFADRTQYILEKDWENLRKSIEDDPVVSIRINPSKITTPLFLEPVKWSNMGFYMDARPSFTFDPLFHAGCYYPQEASSMFIEQAINQYVTGDIHALDLCAAPGGKSTHIVSLLTENSLLVSNEVIRSRANILSENMQKSGFSNVVVTNNDPADFSGLTSFFDLILVDAPCSGEGMFRKDRDAVNEWSIANIRLCRDRQRRILSDVWNALKPGGILIYSTCTYNIEENEENAEWICSELEAEALGLDIPKEWNVTGALRGNLPVYRFLPHKTKGEGFFMAVLRKKGDLKDHPHTQKKKKQKDNKSDKTQQIPDKYLNYIQNPDKYKFRQRGTGWIAFPNVFSEDYLLLQSELKVVSCGVKLGEEKGKGFIPDHSLALSNKLNRDSLFSFEVDWRTAISYLRKESITLENECPRGYILITYKNVPLGFVKNIGNRANNLYPQEWRIRSSNIPETLVSFL